MKKEIVLWVFIFLIAVICVSVYAQGEGGFSIEKGEGVTSNGGSNDNEAEDTWALDSWDDKRPGMDQVLGIVRDGMFFPAPGSVVVLPSFPVRLTGIRMMEAIAPEAKEIHLDEYNGLAIMVEGLSGSGWIYDAIIIDVAGPILSEVVKQLYFQETWLEEECS